MCYHPITIINRSKYVNTSIRSRFFLRVPCGKCEQCQTNKSNEWLLRTYYQCLETWNNNGFVYYDTLTYNEKNVPRISDFFHVDRDFYCFNHKHIRNLCEDLRQVLKRKYNGNLKYFIASEYGTSNSGTHRPHYHVIFFVNADLSPLQFSRLLAMKWKYGLTDGISYKSANYVKAHNVISRESDGLKVTEYVSKYVRKYSYFEQNIDKRIDRTMRFLDKKYSVITPDWLSSLHARSVRERLKSIVSQRHFQSQDFGILALRDIDLNKLVTDNYLVMPSSKYVKLRVWLPTYFKRKLFYDCVEVDKNRVWIPNEDGINYLQQREKLLFDKVSSRLKVDSLNTGIQFNVDEVADYLCNKFGRIKGSVDDDYITKIQYPDLFFYGTRSDMLRFGFRFMSPKFLGNCQVGYNIKLFQKIEFGKFVSKHVFFDKTLDDIIDSIDLKKSQLGSKRQQRYDYSSVLRNKLRRFVT